MMPIVTLDVYVHGSPRTKGSWRPIKTKAGKIRLVPQTKEKPWAALVSAAVVGAKPIRIERPHAAHVYLAFDIKAPKKSRNNFPIGDADKLARSCLDALVKAGALDDDSQVTQLMVRKRWAVSAGCRISVHRAEVLP